MIRKNTPLKEILKIAENCRRCGHCCTQKPGFVLKEEIEKLSESLKISSEKLKRKFLEEIRLFNNQLFRLKKKDDKKPYGECIFYSRSEGCTIHSCKPLYCRIGNCSDKGEELAAWFTVNYLVKDTDPGSIRQFSLYQQTGGKILPEGKVEDLVKDKKLLKKILNYEILR